jgi:hypothetical protein
LLEVDLVYERGERASGVGTRGSEVNTQIVWRLVLVVDEVLVVVEQRRWESSWS